MSTHINNSASLSLGWAQYFLPGILKGHYPMALYPRRKFIRNISLAAFGLQGITAFSGCGGPVKKEENKEENVNKEKAQGKLGIALVGLGTYATDQLAPALTETQHCYLAGVVTGSPD